jgi:apoptosis-inducing factor 3
MGSDAKELTGPDLAKGVELDTLVEGQPLLGHVGDEAAMLVKSGSDVFAVGASCTHYGGPLAEGLVADGTVRCPWHHACFDLRTGLARGPALGPIACFEVVREGALVKLGKKLEPTPERPRAMPSSVVIVGAGVAGAACAETLRREGYTGPVRLIGDEEPGPVDRPNLSKDYLAGNAPEEWIPLRTREFFEQFEVELWLDDAVTAVDPGAHRVTLASGKTLTYGALVLATGASPVRLPLPGADRAHVFTLRTLGDSSAIIARAATAKRAVVIGASFIGLEVAASLRQRGLAVSVVAPESLPLARVLGDELGEFVRGLHAAQGVEFQLGKKPARIEADSVVLDDGTALAAELVVMGVGVRPRVELAERAGLRVENGIVVDESLRSSAPDVFAIGDVARYPWGGAAVRIEHFQVAERHGRSVALVLLGKAHAASDVPFFWSQHYDVTISYVGHAERWDEIRVLGDLMARDAAVVYRAGGRVRAVATIGRDRLGLDVEHAMELGDEKRLEALLG